MRAKPTSTYHKASPQTWELIRAAYLSGLSAPALAARFGVSVGAIRKRAGRDGWTKAAYARTLDGPEGPGPRPGWPAEGAGPAPAAAPAEPPSAWDQLGAALPPLRVSPAGLARRALGDAARALGEHRLDDARRLVSTASAVVRLGEAVDLTDDYSDDPFEMDARQSLLRKAIFQLAIDLSERLRDGRPLPDGYAELHAEMQRGRESDAAILREEAGDG
jgi:hypothetical protein